MILSILSKNVRNRITFPIDVRMHGTTPHKRTNMSNNVIHIPPTSPRTQDLNGYLGVGLNPEWEKAKVRTGKNASPNRPQLRPNIRAVSDELTKIKADMTRGITSHTPDGGVSRVSPGAPINIKLKTTQGGRSHRTIVILSMRAGRTGNPRRPAAQKAPAQWRGLMIDTE
ncbi:lipase-like [Dorcoceras hygrometricum]|uniref:Lipase-like n=1 Tax=Dorcoceras hygrometricum TaxID=472368 RepID=A0A2Z7C8B0_9LAMI|nr:lipase-like [Dorcoceras hygrometricum]